MISKSSIKKKFFEDRSTTALRNGLVYDSVNERYGAAEDILNSKSIATAATQRLGVTNSVSDSYNPAGIENSGYPVGGISIGSLTVFTGSLSEQSAEDLIDFYRYGKDIKDVKRFARATTTIPMIRVSPDGFFDDESTGIIDHSLNFNSYGQGYLFLDVDESVVNQKVIPFEDFSKLIPQNLLGKTSTSGYPFVYNSRKNYSQFVNPSDTRINGAIDIFETRDSIINSSISDIEIKGIKGDFQGGGIELTRRGGIQIKDVIEYKNPQSTEYFEDAQDLLFSDQNFPEVGKRIGEGSEDNKFSFPGIVSLSSYKLSYFKDQLPREDVQKYTILSDTQRLDLLNSSDKNRSEIGSRFKSANCGLIFGESNVLGTDSIAFGGLKK